MNRAKRDFMEESTRIEGFWFAFNTSQTFSQILLTAHVTFLLLTAVVHRFKTF